jgi:septum formation protein
LRLAGVPFVMRAAVTDEEEIPGETPREYVERVARAKLEAVRALGLGPSRTCLVADTIVVSPDGALLRKPTDDEGARAMIERLAGATHEVITRFVLGDSLGGSPPAHAETVTTRVTFRAFAAGEARAYAASGEGTDKAGGYAIQGAAAAFARRIDGSYTNVVGLPLCEVVTALRALGWLTDP